MNLAELQQKLITAARTAIPNDHVPYAFEKRIMACLTAKPVFDSWTLWGRALWRAAASCVAVMLLLGAVSFLVPNSSSSNDLSQEFENTLLAVVDQPEDAW